MELGIDLGTSSTVAFLRRNDGTAEPVLFDGAPLLPSAVYADETGHLLVGRDAIHSARARPERFEAAPKRRIDDGTVFLGVAVPVEALLGALLHRAATEARRIAGAPVDSVTVCHPASWGPARRAVLQRAATATGLSHLRLVPEPVAAAAFHLRRHGAAPADLLVYDLGAGTFDVAVVRYTPPGSLEVLCSGGLDDTGGDDVDAAIVAWLRSRCGTQELWQRLDTPATVTDRAARRQLWDDVRNAKEMLSRTTTTTLHLPLLETNQILTRTDLEQLATPLIQRTVTAIRTTLAECRTELRPLSGTILVGGATRMPLVATLLHRALNLPPTTVDQPELAVAAGSLDPLLTTTPPIPTPHRPAPQMPQTPTNPPRAPMPITSSPSPGSSPSPSPLVPYPMSVPMSMPVPGVPSMSGPPTGPAMQPPTGMAVPPPAGPAVVLTIVEIITIITPRFSGVTLRGQLHAGFGVVEHVFPADADGRLLLFSDTAALGRHAAAHGAHDQLLAVPGWRVRNDGSDELRFDLDLLPEHLSFPPENWLPGYVCRCRDLCAQLAVFLDLDDVDDLIGQYSTIDRADDILRGQRFEPSARAVRRRLGRLDHAQLLDDWVELISSIEECIVQVD